MSGRQEKFRDGGPPNNPCFWDVKGTPRKSETLPDSHKVLIGKNHGPIVSGGLAVLFHESTQITVDSSLIAST
jgi:hypothetical protein